MIAPATKQPERGDRQPAPRTPLNRTCRRLTEAQAAFDRGEMTTCVLLARVAIDTAASESVGHFETRAFMRMLAFEAGVSQRTRKRIRKLGDCANATVHGDRDGTEREARQMLSLIRVIGGRWAKRVFGDAIVPPEELTV